MMEEELNLTVLDGEFITVEVEIQSTAVDEDLNSTVTDEELKSIVLHEEIVCTATEEESKSTPMEEEVIPSATDEESRDIAMEKEVICVAMAEESRDIAMEKEVICAAMAEESRCTATEKEGTIVAMEEESKCIGVEESVTNCYVCDQPFATVSLRNYHLRRVHNIESTKYDKKNMVCPLPDCREVFVQARCVREHIVQTHQIDLEVEEITFRCYEDYLQWKENMERQTKSHFVRNQSTKISNAKMIKYNLKDYYHCNRSGFYTPTSTGKRRGKKFGSRKIGAYCPACLIVSRSTFYSDVQVTHWTKHIGHTCDMNHISLTESEKLAIVDKITKGMSFSEILRSAKASADGSELNRVNLLTRLDLKNIVKQFKLKKKKSDDDHPVSIWVKNMKEHGNDSPVVFYKKEGVSHDQLNLDDFMIVIMTKYQIEMLIKHSGNNICIDSIHGMSSLDFSLTTIVVIDEQSTVFPLAFCISSKTDDVSMMVFFECVKSRVGTIETPVFMSNDDPVFYDAWERVMAPASFQLLSSWHVDKCWRLDLNKIGGRDRNKQVSVYKVLKMLLEEGDVFEFESLLERFVSELREDKFTKKFADHFYKNYFARSKMWAFCYMRHLGISSLEHLEAMHTSLKNLCMNEGEDDNSKSHVDFAFPALLKLSHDALLNKLDKLMQCLPIDWTEKMKYKHRHGLRVFKITPLNDNSWSVKMHIRAEGQVVTKENTDCAKDCYIKCYRCNICIHSFSCTCFDSLINFNVCGHIHACATFCFGTRTAEVARREEEMNIGLIDRKEVVESVEIDEVLDTSVEHEDNSPTALLKNQLNTIKTMMECSEFTVEQTSQLKNSFDAIISFMTMHGKFKKQAIKVPYKPSINYVSTVNKTNVQTQNQAIMNGQPLRLYMVNNFQQT